MHGQTPFGAYYSARVGRWRGTVFMQITSWSAFWRTPMSVLDRLRMVMSVWTSRLLGPPTMLTSVTYPMEGDARRILHTTRVVKWGMTLVSSREVFELHEGNDRTFTVRGEIWIQPTGHARDYGASAGEVLPDASRANYHFVWMGQPLEQRTAEIDGRLAIVQDTAYSRACVVLERYSPTPS